MYSCLDFKPIKINAVEKNKKGTQLKKDPSKSGAYFG